jgi:four helix bundle protein
LIGLVVFIGLKPYRLARIAGYIDPGSKIISSIDTSGRIEQYMHQSLTSRDTSYQLEQSKIAVGTGGIVGAGLMQGKQKLLYLPEAHTDFIYAVVSEELGLFGSAGLLLAFIVILWRGLRAAFRMPDDFGRYLALGITTVVVVQGLMNISVVLGMMPTKGIPLPMISSGGSSLLSTLASLGILMNVSEHAGLGARSAPGLARFARAGLGTRGWGLGFSFVSDIRSFKELRVWQGAMGLVEGVYSLSLAFPAEENYGLKSQIRRAAVSIPSNIAEGHTRASTREYLNHLSIAQASLAEVETQLEIAVRLRYLSLQQVDSAVTDIQTLGRQLHALRNALEARK